MKKLVLPLVALPSMPQPPVGVPSGAPDPVRDALRSGLNQLRPSCHSLPRKLIAPGFTAPPKASWATAVAAPPMPIDFHAVAVGEVAVGGVGLAGCHQQRRQAVPGGRVLRGFHEGVSVEWMSTGDTGSGHQSASRRPLTTLLGHCFSGLSPFSMQSPVRDVERPLVLRAGERAAVEREVRDVGGLVRAAAVVDAPGLVGAVHEEAAPVAFDTP